MNASPANFSLRVAHEEDAPALETLIDHSARSLLIRHYSNQQIEAALGPVFGLDRQLIRDRTYFVIEQGEAMVACGGWSKRQSWFGGRPGGHAAEPELSPETDSARVRAFFVHPQWERRGLGRLLLGESERAIEAAGFKTIELVATLAGEALYAAHGYRVLQREPAALPGGLRLETVRMMKHLA
jgi:N-acetylglutamate synthase-like GNAT family acetyltransferase